MDVGKVVHTEVASRSDHICQFSEHGIGLAGLENKPRAGNLDHPPDPCRRARRIERNIDSAGLQNREKGSNCRYRLRRHYADTIERPKAKLSQTERLTVTLPVEFGKVYRRGLIDYG